MREGRRPRRQPAVATDEPQVESPDVENNGPGPAPELLPEPAPSRDAASAGEAGEAAEVGQGQLSMQVFEAAAGADAGTPDDGAPHDGEDFEEPVDSADLLVSISNETLAGQDETEEETDRAGEWVYPGQGAGARGGHGGVDGFPGEVEPTDALEAGRLPIRMAELDARPMPYEAEPSLVDQPALQIRLARIHLRTGALFLARAELESLAAREQLDTAAHLDLAEARWRTGDLQGAGEAATAYLADGGDEALGFVISAEAFALANRLDDARQHAAYALERHLSELDPVFAGMPRRAEWPASTWNTVQPRSSAAAGRVTPPVEPAEPQPTPEPIAAASAPEAEPGPVVAEAALRPVDAAETDAPPAAEPAPMAVEPEPQAAPEPVAAETSETSAAPVEETGALAEVESGRLYLAASDPMMAALHFGVAIRLAPATAGAVLEAIGDRQELPLQLVRGDALRLLGLEADAGTMYQSVASALSAGKTAAESAARSVQAPATTGTAPQPSAQGPAEPAPAEVAPAQKPGPVEPPPLRWE